MQLIRKANMHHSTWIIEIVDTRMELLGNFRQTKIKIYNNNSNNNNENNNNNHNNNGGDGGDSVT
jgi:hypothetical protein